MIDAPHIYQDLSCSEMGSFPPTYTCVSRTANSFCLTVAKIGDPARQQLVSDTAQTGPSPRDTAACFFLALGPVHYEHDVTLGLDCARGSDGGGRRSLPV